MFLPLLNEVDSETVKEGSRFRIWRFKPGQRGEVLLPGRRWMEEIPLPRGAVANDEGVRYVFRHVATRQAGDATVDDFAPQRVTVLYEDADTTLIPASSLPAGSSIAMGQADRLLRWLKGRPDH